MANEIQKQIILKHVDGNRGETRSIGNIKTDQATTEPAVRRAPFSLQASTVDAVMTFGGMDSANYGECLLTNLSTTVGEYIIVGPDNAGAVKPFCHIYPGRQASMQLIPGTTYRFKSATGTPLLDGLMLSK
jgi:hypothetical protein